MKTLIICLAVLLSSVQYKLWLAPGNVQDVRIMRTQLVEQKMVNNQLHQRNHHLRRQINSVKENDGLLEEYARNEIGMIREDEVFYHIIDR